MKRILAGAAGLVAAGTLLLAPNAQAEKIDIGPAGAVYAGGGADGGYVIADGKGSPAPTPLGGYIGFSGDEDGIVLYGSCTPDKGSGQDGTSRRNQIDPTAGDTDTSECSPA